MLTVLIESELIGVSTVNIYINIESEIETELRFEFGNIQGQWIPEGIDRPKIIEKDSLSYFDGILQVKFPTDFVVPLEFQTKG